jgi:cytochrome P450
MLADMNPQHLIAKFRAAEKKTRGTFYQGNFGEAITNNVFFLYAGSTVASNCFPMVVHLLYSHPEVLAKVRAELATLPNGHVCISDLERKDGQPCRIPYTEATLLEALRLTPTFGPTLTRAVPSIGCQLNEFFIPPGYEVGMSGWAVNYDKSYFGADAAEFKPQRWLGNHPTELAKDGSGQPRTMRNYLEGGWFTFGAGARVCVGRNLTMIGFAKGIAAITKEFDVELVKKPYYWYSLIVHAEEMMIKLRKRDVPVC